MCDCREKVNEHFAKFNTRVAPTIAVVDGRFQVCGVQIVTEKLDTSKRGRPKALTAAFCPFCGAKYPYEAAVSSVVAP